MEKKEERNKRTYYTQRVGDEDRNGHEKSFLSTFMGMWLGLSLAGGGGLVSHRLFSLPAAQLISHLGQTKTKTRKKKKKPREPSRKIYIRARKEEKSEKKKRTWFGAAAWMNRFNHGWSDRHLLLKLGGKVLDSIPKANGGEVWNRIFLFPFSFSQRDERLGKRQ